jgi:hypothetical protein
MASRKPIVMNAGRAQQLQSGDTLGGLGAAATAGEAVRFEQNKRAITVTFDGQGSVPTVGSKARVTCPLAGTITKVTCEAADGTSGSFVVDIWKSAYSTSAWPTVSNTITASAKPTLTSAMASTDSALTGWTKTISVNDMLVVNLDSVSTTTIAQIVIEFDPS